MIPRLLARALALPLAAALASCAGAPPRTAPAAPAAPVAPQLPAEYFPLEVGNSWTYLDRSAQQPGTSHHTVRIIRRDGDGYFVDDQRGALRADPDCLHDRLRRLLCVPIEAGSTWSSVVSASVTERYRIVAVGETVTVPAGTFHGCVRVRSNARVEGVPQAAELTYAPGVGLVRLETFSFADGTAAPQVRAELESYRVGGGK